MSETIKASDLAKLMEVVQCATTFYNEVEVYAEHWHGESFMALGKALRDLGLREGHR